ncbi:MAG: histidine kinase [Chloroflexota bacterium]
MFPFVSAQPSDVQAVLLARDISEFEHNHAAMSQASEVIRLDLEQRVLERSQQLTRVNQELRNEILLRRLAEQQYLRSTRRAEALANVAARLNTQLDLQPLLETITQQTILALNYPVCCLFLYDEENDRLTVTAMTGLAYADGQKPGFPRALYDSYRLAVGPVVVIADVPKMPGEFEQVMLRSLPLRTMILVSMQSGEELVGALMVASQDDVHLPTHDEVLLLQALAEQATVAISNARLFREVNESHESLRLLSKQLVNAQEAEKRRLARELHDEVGQMLTSLNLNLGAINQGLEAPQPSRRQVHEQIEQTRQMVDHLLQQVRDMSLDLRPSILDDLGLLPAVLALTDRYTAQTGVQVALRHNDLARRCPPEIETAAFRMIQEALTNVARHAQVETVAVRLLSGPLSLVVQVEDNGGGFDPEQVRRLASSGLSGMQERVRLCGGSLQIEAHPGRGACLTAEFPLDPPMETPYWTARDPAAQAGEP